MALTTQTTYKKSLECTTLTHENVGIYVKLHSCITDSKREDEDPKWNIHKCDLGFGKQTTKYQFSNVQLNDDQNLEHTCTCMYQQFEDNFLNFQNEARNSKDHVGGIQKLERKNMT